MMEDNNQDFEKNYNFKMRRIQLSQEKLDSLWKKLNSESNPKMQDVLKTSIARTQNVVDVLCTRLRIMRPAIQEDIEYRLNVYNNFGREVGSILPKESPICFHGTEFCNIEKILQSGALSSSVDRFGYSTSYDVENQVSVTVVESLDVTIRGYTGLLTYEEPAGCVFMVLPKDENEYNSSRMSMLIGNVDFRNEPERLVGILTTPENVEQIKNWCKQYGIDCAPENICTFDDFLEKNKANNNYEEM